MNSIMMTEQQQQQLVFKQSSTDMNLSSTADMTFLQDDAIMYQDQIKPGKKASGNFRTSFYNPFEIKHRKRTSRAQFEVLEKTFLENPKPNASVRRWLAQQLVMTPRGVQVWFQNRRAKEKSNSTKREKRPTSEQLVKQSSTSSYESVTTPILSSPSMCACPDCFATATTPMSRTLSYPSFEEDIMTPVTPLDSYFLMNRPQWSSPNWPFSPEEEDAAISCFNPPMMRRMYTTNMMFDHRASTMLDDKSIQSTELFRRLSEPIFTTTTNNVNFNTYNLIPRSNSFTAL